MSMNLVIIAQREIIVKVTGKEEIQEVQWKDEWQTPSIISYEIAESAYPILAYKTWVVSLKNQHENIEECYQINYSLCTTEQLETLADLQTDDAVNSTEEGEKSLEDYKRTLPGRITDDYREHILGLESWVSERELEGYKISVRVI